MDRLTDLANADEPDSHGVQMSPREGGDAPSSSPRLGGGGADEEEDERTTEQILNDFYSAMSKIQEDIRTIQSNSAVLSEKHSDKMQTADMEKSSAIGEEIEVITHSVNGATKSVKDSLEKMKKGTEKLKKDPETAAANAAVIKIQENQHAHLLRTFLAVVNTYQQLQGENEKHYREQTQRRIKMRYTNEDGSTIDDDRAAELAQEAIEFGTENAIFQQSKDTLAMIMENRNDIYKIEQNMRELNQLFHDLAVLVNEQGEVMNQILQNVEHANQYVEKGRKELAKAKKYHKKSRKKFCFIIIGVAVVVGFLLAVILGFTIPTF